MIMLLLLCLWWTSLFLPATAWAAAAGTTEATPASRIIRIGFIDLKDYAVRNSDQTYEGITVEYAYKIAQYANLKIKVFLYKNGQQALNDLDHDQIDMMCNVVKNATREEKYLFTTHEVGRIAMCAFVRKDEDRFAFGNTAQLGTMTFGVEQDSMVQNQFRNFCSIYNITPKIQTFTNLEAIKNALNNGLIDAGLYGSPAVEGFRTIHTFAPLPYYFVLRKADAGLKAKIDDAMSNILSEDPIYYDRLVQKYTTPDFSMEMLTREEKEYIARHPDLTIAVVAKDWPYFKGLENGEPRGMIPDIYARIAKLTGLKPHYKIFPSHAEALKAVTSGTADVLGLYSNGQIPAYSSGLRLTRIYDSVDMVMLTRAGTNRNMVKKIAIKSRNQNALQDPIKHLFKIEAIPYDGIAACFQALKDEKVDAFVCGIPTATWLVNQNQVSAYKMITIDSHSMDLCGATAYNNQILCSILSKAINNINHSFNEILTDNTISESRWQTMLARIPYTFTAVLTIVLLLLVLGLLTALIQLYRRHKEQEAMNRAKIATERREIELAALEKNFEAKNAFFSNISHDMRTPLNAILGFTRLAKEKGLTPQKQAEYLEKVETSGNILLDLINDTLTLSKVGSGKLELHPEPLRAAELFDNIVTPIRVAAANKQITLTTDSTAITGYTILADKLCLQKIFLNLLTNAIKYTPQGGQVWFTIHNVQLENGQLDSVTTIKDNGIGISPEFLPHIFEPFTQENRVGYETGGTGLGLAIVKQYVQLMGGTITVSSKKDQGTEFNVRLRLKQVDAPQTTTAAAAPETAVPEILQGRQVLLCEDNKLNQEIAQALLKAKGMTVVLAANGQEGIDTFAASGPGTFAAILMDVHMPVLDGLAATRRIRSLARADARTVPIIAMTADAFEEDIQRCLAAGMNEHIPKPVSPELLYQKLSAAIAQRN
jgi:signal transduction histidine kinase/ActR/RegA family two-component response regulator